MNEGIRQPGEITIDSTDEERTAILSEKMLTIVPWDEANEMVKGQDESIAQSLNRYSQELHLKNKEVLFGDFEGPVKFTYTTLKESIYQMTRRHSDLTNLGKLLSVLEPVCANAIKIQIEPYRHKSRKGLEVKQVHQLLSAFCDDREIYPVKITIHEKLKQYNQFYMVITVSEISLRKIKEDSPNTGAAHLEMNGSLSDGGASLNVTIPTLISDFKRDEGIILKNLPDGLLNEKQKEIKQKAFTSDIEKENEIQLAQAIKDAREGTEKLQVEEKLKKAMEHLESLSANSVSQTHLVKGGFEKNQLQVAEQEIELKEPGIDGPEIESPTR